MSQHEEWQCGTCAYWEKRGLDDQRAAGRCTNLAAVDSVVTYTMRDGDRELLTFANFGCRFWARKPLEDKAS